MIAIKVLLKGDKEFKWAGTYKYFQEALENITDKFELVDGISKVSMFHGNSLEYLNPDRMNSQLEFYSPVDVIIFYLFDLNTSIEFKRDPHKLILGIEEFMITNKTTIFDKL